MRFSQPVRMADGDGSPVWARSRKRGGIPIVGLLVTLLALFGALTAVLGIKEQSLAAGGAADDAAAEAGAAAAKAGDALQAGAETTANEMKR